MANATIYLKGKNQIGEAVKSASQDLHTLTDTAGKVTKVFAAAFGIGSAVAIIKKSTQQIKKYFDNVKDPEIADSVEKMKKSWDGMKTTLSTIVNYSIKPLVTKFEGFFSGLTENIGNIATYIAAVIKNLPELAKLALQTIFKLITVTFSWQNLKELFVLTVKNLTVLIGAMLKGVFQSIPQMLSNLLVAIGSFLLSVEESIRGSILGAIESVINGARNKVADSWVGKLFGMDKDKKLIDLGADTARANAQKFRDQAANSMSNVGDIVSDAVGEAIGAVKEVMGNTADYFSSTYGPVLEEFTDGIHDIIEPTVKEIKFAVEEATSAQTEAAAATTEATTETKKDIRTFLDDIGDKFGNWVGKFFKASSEQGSAFGGNVIGNLTGSLGEAGNLINDLAKNMSTMGPVLGAIATALKYIIEGFAETFGGILNEFVTYGIEPLRELGRVIGDLVGIAFNGIMPLVETVGNLLTRLFNSIGSVLSPIIRTLSNSLRPVLDIIANVLEGLEPVFKLFAKSLTAITATIEYVVQGLQHMVAVLFNWLASLNLMGWKPFSGLRTTDPGAPGNYISYLGDRLNAVDASFSSSIGVTSGTSTGIATSSASYMGATSVTINIYQEAPVVGDGGMRQFARMIRNEFDSLSYYGVGA